MYTTTVGELLGHSLYGSAGNDELTAMTVMGTDLVAVGTTSGVMEEGAAQGGTDVFVVVKPLSFFATTTAVIQFGTKFNDYAFGVVAAATLPVQVYVGGAADGLDALVVPNPYLLATIYNDQY